MIINKPLYFPDRKGQVIECASCGFATVQAQIAVASPFGSLLVSSEWYSECVLQLLKACIIELHWTAETVTNDIQKDTEV